MPERERKRSWPWNAAGMACIWLAFIGIMAGFNSRYPGTGWFFLVQSLLGGLGVFCACVAADRERGHD